MRPDRQQLTRVILASLAEEGVTLPNPAPDLAALRFLDGPMPLQSVALVAMLVGVEQRLADEFGVQISLMDEHALSQTRSPFRSAATLLAYLEQRLRNTR